MSRARTWLSTVVLLAALAGGGPRRAAAQSSPDPPLQERVVAAIHAASDLPADSIHVRVEGGVVTLSGVLVCDRCGANATPGGTATLEQNLGAVVRAVPGVERVEIELEYGNR